MLLLYPLASYSVTEGNWVEQMNHVGGYSSLWWFSRSLQMVWFFPFQNFSLIWSWDDKSIILQIHFPYNLPFTSSFILHLFSVLSQRHAVRALRMETDSGEEKVKLSKSRKIYLYWQKEGQEPPLGFQGQMAQTDTYPHSWKSHPKQSLHPSCKSLVASPGSVYLWYILALFNLHSSMGGHTYHGPLIKQMVEHEIIHHTLFYACRLGICAGHWVWQHPTICHGYYSYSCIFSLCLRNILRCLP